MLYARTQNAFIAAQGFAIQSADNVQFAKRGKLRINSPARK